MAGDKSSEIVNPQAHQTRINMFQTPPVASVLTTTQPTLGTGAGLFVIERTLRGVANLVKLLPSGTTIVFQALSPSFTNRGTCYTSNKYLTAILVGICTFTCFLFPFTDSFIGRDGQIYYGVATFNGFFLFNRTCDYTHYTDDRVMLNTGSRLELRKLRVRTVDFVHAFFSCLVFLALAASETQVQKCFFDGAGVDAKELLVNLPLGIGILSSIVFLMFPTCRRGIGYSDHSKTLL